MPILDQFRLEGRRALVTGGSRGLGLEMARALGEAGAELIIVGSDPGHLQKAVDELTAAGHQAQAVQADLASPAEAERLCERLLNDFPPIDILVNNVGGRR